MTSQSNFNLRFSKRSLNLVRGFLFQFDVIWEVCVLLVTIYMKNGYFKTKNDGLATQQREYNVIQQLETKIF